MGECISAITIHNSYDETSTSDSIAMEIEETRPVKIKQSSFDNTRLWHVFEAATEMIMIKPFH